MTTPRRRDARSRPYIINCRRPARSCRRACLACVAPNKNGRESTINQLFTGAVWPYMQGKERKSIYIALFWPRCYTQSAQAWITQFYHACLSFVSVHQMSPPQQLRQRTSNCSSLLIYRPLKDERLSWPSWLTYSG